MTAIRTTMTPGDWLLLFGLSLLWGGSFFFGEVALQELPPLSLVLGRVVLAALGLTIILGFQGQVLPQQGHIWLAFAVMGLLNNALPFSLIFWGQLEISSSLAAILNASTPLWTVMLAHFLTTDEKLRAHNLSGVILGFLGVTIMIGPAALSGFGQKLIAQGAVLAAALSYALAGIYGRRFKTLGLSPLSTATGQLICSSLWMLPLVLIIDQPWRMAIPGLTTWAALLSLALLSTALAYLIYFQLLARAGASNLLLVTFLIPVSALILGMSVLGERLSLHQGIGMIFIGLGLAAIDGRLWRWLHGNFRRRE